MSSFLNFQITSFLCNNQELIPFSVSSTTEVEFLTLKKIEKLKRVAVENYEFENRNITKILSLHGIFGEATFLSKQQKE